MLITIAKRPVLIPNDIKEDTFKVFSFMKGNSPFFYTLTELNSYYKSLSPSEKMKHLSKGRLLVAFIHKVAAKDFVLDKGGHFEHHAKKGEILSTDELWVYDFNQKKYL